MKFKLISYLIIILIVTSINSSGKDDKPAKEDSLKNVSLSGLSFRSIGPAITGGRTIDIAVNPNDISVYYIASGNGGLWKTTDITATTPTWTLVNDFLSTFKIIPVSMWINSVALIFNKTFRVIDLAYIMI